VIDVMKIRVAPIGMRMRTEASRKKRRCLRRSKEFRKKRHPCHGQRPWAFGLPLDSRFL
jgi:hypothetical protein